MLTVAVRNDDGDAMSWRTVVRSPWAAYQRRFNRVTLHVTVAATGWKASSTLSLSSLKHWNLHQTQRQMLKSFEFEVFVNNEHRVCAVAGGEKVIRLEEGLPLHSGRLAVKSWRCIFRCIFDIIANGVGNVSPCQLTAWINTRKTCRPLFISLTIE